MIRQRVRAGLNVIKQRLARDGKFVSKAGKVRTRLGRPGAEAHKLELAGPGAVPRYRYRQDRQASWARHRHRHRAQAEAGLLAT